MKAVLREQRIRSNTQTLSQLSANFSIRHHILLTRAMFANFEPSRRGEISELNARSSFMAAFHRCGGGENEPGLPVWEAFQQGCRQEKRDAVRGLMGAQSP